MEAAGTSIRLVMKAVLLSARWAGRSRRLGLEQAAKASGDVAEVHAENVVLRDTVECLIKRLACAERRLKAANIRKPYSVAERLHILWCVEYFGIPRRRIPECLGVARSTVWRWLRRLQDGIGLCGRRCQASVHRTAEQLERLVWAIRDLNPQWGRRRIAMVLGTLGIFLAASTVRNILLRPRPRPARPLLRPESLRRRSRGRSSPTIRITCGAWIAPGCGAGASGPVLSNNSSARQSALTAFSRATDHCTRPQTICDMVRPQNARIVFFGGTRSQTWRIRCDPRYPSSALCS